MSEKPKTDEELKRMEMIKRATNFLSDPRIKPMPSTIGSIRNGTLICAERDMPEIGTKKGDMFPIVFDGEHIRGGSLDGPSWGVDQLMEEFTNKKWWTVAGQLDEWVLIPDSDSKK